MELPNKNNKSLLLCWEENSFVNVPSKNNKSGSIKFYINGKEKTVETHNADAKETLVDYIRNVANLKGTKVMCREGGCGVCLITAKVINPHNGATTVKSVNSCLVPVLSCDGWDISTVERLGNKHEGYHDIQTRLANFHGTQCGYCTPGIVMNMNSLIESKENVCMEDIEGSLDGNICRCTGYRPILDALKSMTNDASEELKKKCVDIEDTGKCPLKLQNGQIQCEVSCKAHESSSHVVKITKNGEEWITAKTIEQALVAAVSNHGLVHFLGGNTSTGILKNDPQFGVFIDLNGVAELKETRVTGDGIIIGGEVTLSELMHFLMENSEKAGLEYGSKIAKHLERVACTSIRNTGTIAGNLMMKHNHPQFSSDIFVLLECIGATLTIASGAIKKRLGWEKISIETLKPLSMLDFLETDMTSKLIKCVHFPLLSGCNFRTFKISRRYQNSQAYVNAAFLIKTISNDESSHLVEGRPRLVFGGVSPSFVHASATESILEGKSLSDPETLRSIWSSLEQDLCCIQERSLTASVSYRKQLVKSLLYKTILHIVGEKVPKRFLSGGTDITRSGTSGKQVFDKDSTNDALYKAIPKNEAFIQASGEAEYTGDIPIRNDELFGAFVLSTEACAELEDIDASEALKIPGVVQLITAKDIPGLNDTMKFNFMPSRFIEPVFVAKKISYYGQALGLLLATSQSVADSAAKLLKVKYSSTEKPVVNMDEAIEKAKAEGTYAWQTMGKYSTKPDSSINATQTLKGNFRTGSQYHFHMETQSVVCHPREDGIDVYCSSQYHDHVQNTVSSALNIPTNAVNVTVRRLGGGFGGKVKTATFVATPCAVACWTTGRPVRIILDLETNMNMLGKRHPFMIPYEVTFDKEGRIGSLKMDVICDSGYTANEPTAIIALIHLQNVYKAIGWEIDTHFVTTNTPSNTFCRAPGSLQAVAVMEWIMDHIASQLKLDPLQVRQVNLLQTGDAMLFGSPSYTRENLIPEMIEKMKDDADFENRKTLVESFNRENRWKKRGIAVIPARFAIEYHFTIFPVSVAIFHADGHIAVTHGGIEMGQGINTKVVQTVAQILQVPVDKIKVKPTNSFVGANAYPTVASVASEMVCYSTMRACEELRENLRPIMEKMENLPWEKIITEAYQAKIKLTASYTPTANEDLKPYDVWILNATEVEIDVLTGEYKILRTDLYEDAGKSMSPGIDLGQIEGGYIFGLGFWTSENIEYDNDTGKLLTNNTWHYKPPQSKDIPEDFRITLWRNAPNPFGILRSKATGEPSVVSAFAAVLALRNAVAAARNESGNDEWFEMDFPVTPEEVSRLCLLSDSQFSI